jgi:hypothetical protein
MSLKYRGRFSEETFDSTPAAVNLYVTVRRACGMMNLYYRGYVIHQDIRAICYTVFGRRPHRLELANSGTVREAMRWVDGRVAKKAAAQWVERHAARAKSKLRVPVSQPALL